MPVQKGKLMRSNRDHIAYYFANDDSFGCIALWQRMCGAAIPLGTCAQEISLSKHQMLAIAYCRSSS